MILFTTSLNVVARDTEAPDMALLEFIGDSVSAGDDMVDPMDWQAMQNTPIGQQATKSSTGSGQAPQHDQAQSQQQTDKGNTSQ